MFDEEAVALLLSGADGTPEKISLLDSRINVNDMLAVKSMFCMCINDRAVYFERLTDYIHVLEVLKLKVRLQRFCEIMGYAVPRTQEEAFALDIIPSGLLQRAQQVCPRREVPDCEVRLPGAGEDEDDEDSENSQET